MRLIPHEGDFFGRTLAQVHIKDGMNKKGFGGGDFDFI